MKTAHSPSGAGFSLIECMVYLAVLVILLELTFEAFYRTQKQNSRLEKTAADIVRTLRAGERWRADIRQATAAPQWSGAGAARELRIPRAGGAVAYAFRDHAVWRRARPGGAWEPWLKQVKDSQMLEDPRREVTAWRWDLELQWHQERVRVRPLFSFLAVPPPPPPTSSPP
ncbi:MAG: hypothetical protein JXQ71_06055 [Verrucomicrobia bacterium]|nr:hypothetical protein [Verrucomicrobiota bacterium]